MLDTIHRLPLANEEKEMAVIKNVAKITQACEIIIFFCGKRFNR
jgi:hypothetical protein